MMESKMKAFGKLKLIAVPLLVCVSTTPFRLVFGVKDIIPWYT